MRAQRRWLPPVRPPGFCVRSTTRHVYEPVTLYMGKHGFCAALDAGVRQAQSEHVLYIVKARAQATQTLAELNVRFMAHPSNADGTGFVFMRCA